jgi:hypothetical protein
MIKLINNLISLIFFLILLFALYKILSNSNIDKTHFYIFLFISFVIILILKITYLKFKIININFIVLLILITIFSYVYEFFLMINNQKTIDAQIKNIDEQTTKIEIFQKKKKQNPKKNVSVVTKPFNFIDYNNIGENIFPLSGKSLSLTINCNENGYWSTYESDRYGFNNPNIVWDKSIDIGLIGDSFLHGACVNSDEDIGYFLRKKLINKNIVNLGYRGNNPLISYASFKEYLYNKHEKMHLVWFFFEGNDLKHLNKEINHKLLSKYLGDDNFSQNLINNQKKIDNLIDYNIKFEQEKFWSNFNDEINNKINSINSLQNLIKLRLLRKYIESYVNLYFQSMKDKKQLKNFEIILKRIKQDLKLSNSVLIFCYLPSYERFRYNVNYNYNDVKTIVENQGVTFIDFVKIFNETNEPLKFFPNQRKGHYNSVGYKYLVNNLINNSFFQYKNFFQCINQAN